VWGGATEMACSACTVGAIKPAGDLCNACACQADGTWLCTNKTCPACTPGTQSGDGTVRCQNCTCNDAGGWVCSLTPLRC
jgi:hypothetical protein